MKTLSETPRPVGGPSAWKGAEMRDRTDWIVTLRPAELDDLDAALVAAKARGLRIGGFTRAEFALPRLAPRLREWLAEIRDGRGFVLLRGFPVERYPEADLRLMYWGMGTHLGTAISQNSYGDLLGDVRDEGVTHAQKVRSYRTRAELKFHTDRADLVGLLCFRKAKEGGTSSLASSMAIYNEILARHPEYLPALRRGFFYINVEEGGDLGQWRVPVFSEKDGVVSCRYSRNTIEVARRAGAALDDVEMAALDFIDRVAASPALRLDMDLEPGDIQLINSFTTLHARTEFVDHDDPALKRRMLRLWLKLDPRRPLGPHFAEYDGVPKKLERTPTPA
jgi:hypothetical protein